MVIIVLIVVGLIFGSFVNAFVWRHYKRAELSLKLEELQEAGKDTKQPAKIQRLQQERRGLSIGRGRSRCTHCGHELQALDLVPVVSYVWLRGRCRYCRARIEDTPLAETLLPLLFVVSYEWWPMAREGKGLFVLIFWLLFMVGFTMLILYDLRWFLLPHSIVLPLIGLALLQIIIVAAAYGRGWPAISGPVLGALVIGGLFYVLYKVSHEQWIGGGDITLGVLLGLLVGRPSQAFLVIFLASLLGTIVALPLLVMGKANRGTHLPFGPFLIIGAVVTMLFGMRIINWYTGHFLAASTASFIQLIT